jgi:hypothetical protein
MVTLQLIDDIQVLHPLSVAVNAADVRVPLALLANLTLRQAVIHCVLHFELRGIGTPSLGRGGAGVGEGSMRRRTGTGNRQMQLASGEAQSGGMRLTGCGLVGKRQSRISALSREKPFDCEVASFCLSQRVELQMTKRRTEATTTPRAAATHARLRTINLTPYH